MSCDFPKPANSLPLGVAHETKKYYVADERTTDAFCLHYNLLTVSSDRRDHNP